MVAVPASCLFKFSTLVRVLLHINNDNQSAQTVFSHHKVHILDNFIAQFVSWLEIRCKLTHIWRTPCVIFAILPMVRSSAVKNPVSSITVIHVGCGITQLKDIVSTGMETYIKLYRL